MSTCASMVILGLMLPADSSPPTPSQRASSTAECLSTGQYPHPSPRPPGQLLLHWRSALPSWQALSLAAELAMLSGFDEDLAEQINQASNRRTGFGQRRALLRRRSPGVTVRLA
jgi:hypothetical protein